MLDRTLQLFGRRLCPALALTLMIACGGAPEDSAQDEVLADDAKADSASAELKAALPGTTLWVKRTLSRTTRNGADALVLAGRTSRNLTGGMGFICDDHYGAFNQLSARKFELVWMLDESRGLVTGVNQFVRLDFAGSPQHLNGFLTVQPQLGSWQGSGATLEAELQPVLVSGRTVFRLNGSTASADNADSEIYGVSVIVGTTRLEEVTLVDETHFYADLSPDQVLALAGTSGEVAVAVDLLSGTATKRARIGLRVKQLQLAASDPYQTWPSPSCTTTVKACLGKLPVGSLDLSSCGTAREVEACRSELGVLVDGAALQVAIAGVDARLVDAVGFGGDAAALVGDDQLATFTPVVRAAAIARLQGESNQWYLDPSARDAALKLAVDEVIDRAYATPLAFIAPHDPLPDSEPRRRQVAADGLLQYLAAQDLAGTEYGKSLRQLARVFRARHVAALRALRETVQPDVEPGQFRYSTKWLSSPVEVVVSESTGKVLSVFFEID